METTDLRASKNIRYRAESTGKHYKSPQKIWFKRLETRCRRFISRFALLTSHKRYITALHSLLSASFKKIKTFHLYTTAGAHYNTIEPYQSNFVRVNRSGGSMRSGLYKYLKLNQSQSEDIRLRNKAVVCPFLFFRAAKSTAVNNRATDNHTFCSICLQSGLAQTASVQSRLAMLQYTCIMSE